MLVKGTPKKNTFIAKLIWRDTVRYDPGRHVEIHSSCKMYSCICIVHLHCGLVSNHAAYELAYIFGCYIKYGQIMSKGGIIGNIGT